MSRAEASKVALVCQSAFLIHSLFSFLWEVREEVEEVKVGRRLKTGYQRKRPCPCSGQQEQSKGRVLEGSPSPCPCGDGAQ